MNKQPTEHLGLLHVVVTFAYGFNKKYQSKNN